MARIPEHEVERLKAGVSVAALARARGIALVKSGDNLLGLCPFHDDREPSLVISESKNLWHCLGACRAGGSVIDWVMRANGVSFRHAVELLRGEPDLSLAAGSGESVKRSLVPKLSAPIAPEAADQELLDQTIGFYHQALLASPEALAYLAKRGLDHPEVAARFRLGFANRTLGYRLPGAHVKAGAELRGRLQALGILRASGHEHFAGSLVIPVFDEQHRVTEVYGRKITEHLRAGTPQHLYLPGPHRGVWNLAGLRNQEEIILCEALIDALTFWCAGFTNVTAAYGVEGFTPDHLAVLRQNKTRRVLIAFDRDEAGDAAALKLAAKLRVEGFACYRIHFPKGMDANAYALKVQPAQKSLGLVIRQAAWLGEGAAPGEGPGQQVSHDDAPAVPATEAAAKEKITPAAVESSVLPLAAAVAAAVTPPDVTPAPSSSDDELMLSFGDRRYRIRGLAKNLSFETLKVNVLVSRGEQYYVDTLDLYSARSRGFYILQAAKEIAVADEVVKLDLGRVLLQLETRQEQAIKAKTEVQPTAVVMREEERAEALALLRDPHLLDRILADFTVCGMVGERVNKLVGYLAATSRKLASPLAVVVRSSSAAGKSSLMDAVLALMPEEERIKYSAMTGQSLFYMGQTNLKHKILAIAEEEGAARASYALKLLQSEGELTIASTGKDPATGNLVTQEYRVEGPVMIFLTTTALDLDPELLNRCLMLTVDEGREQTQAIHRRQREKRTREGLLASVERDQLLALHRNAQRLLQPLAVLNPYACALTFPDGSTRLRRAHEHYLTLIDTVALLHQHQRPIKSLTKQSRAIDYIEVTLDDIALANRLAHEVLGRSLDELPPQTRSLLAKLSAWVTERAQAQQVRRSDIHFSRRELREALNVGDTQMKVHLARLAELEYLIAHRALKGGGLVYELAYDGAGQDGQPFVPGLIDVEALKREYDESRSGLSGAPSAPGRGSVGGWSVPGRSVLHTPVAPQIAGAR